MVGAVVVALVFWLTVFVVLFTAQGSSPLEYLFGPLEPLPDDLGIWHEKGAAPSSRLIREERLLLPARGERATTLLRQVRYRDRLSGEIVSSEPEQVVPRRRTKGGGTARQ